MSNKVLLILLGVTVLVVVAGIVAYTGRATKPMGGRDVEFLFADLTERANDVATLTVVGADASFQVARDGDAWSLADKGGYPADFKKIREVIIALSQLKVVEPKTSRPEHYAKLGVVEPDAEGATSTKITLADGAGQELASVILGERDFNARTARLYVRKSGDAQSWLVEGNVNVDGRTMSWIEREVVRLGRERVKAVSITHPDGECVYAFKNDRDESNFMLADLPEDRELQWEGVVNASGTALASLRIEDVAPRDDVVFDLDAVTVTEWTTFDGIVMTAEICDVDGTPWVKLAARYEAPPEDAAPEDEPVEDEPAEGDDDEVPPPLARDEAAELQETHGRWAYALSASTAINMRKKLDDLLKALPEPEPVPEPGPEAVEETAPPVEDPAAGTEQAEDDGDG